jgi:hypothetical protein
MRRNACAIAYEVQQQNAIILRLKVLGSGLPFWIGV